VSHQHLTEESSSLASEEVLSQASHTGNRCKRCGGETHPVQQCPARNVVCFKCSRKGHFKKHCLSKTVLAITEDIPQFELQGAEEGPDFYLDTTSTKGAEKLLRIEVLVNNKKVQLKVDTGAEVTAISVFTWKSLGDGEGPKLHATKKVLQGPDSKPLSVVGVATLPLSF